MNTKRASEERKAALIEWLLAAGPEGKASLVIDWVGGGPTNTGRTDYLQLRMMTAERGRPEMLGELSYLVSEVLGYRFNRKREAISMGGCGYSKGDQIARDLARMAGHDLFVFGSAIPQQWMKGG